MSKESIKLKALNGDRRQVKIGGYAKYPQPVAVERAQEINEYFDFKVMPVSKYRIEKANTDTVRIGNFIMRWDSWHNKFIVWNLETNQTKKYDTKLEATKAIKSVTT